MIMLIGRMQALLLYPNFQFLRPQVNLPVQAPQIPAPNIGVFTDPIRVPKGRPTKERRGEATTN